MKINISLCLLLFNIIINPAVAIEPDELRTKLAKAAPTLGIDSIADSILEGFYQVRLVDGSMLQVTADGEHFVYGDLYALREDDVYNYTEEDRKKARLTILNSIDEASMIVFAPFGETKATVTVFTDIDCGYCRKLHSEVPELNSRGIAVRYLAYPRSGIFNPGTRDHTASFKKLMSSWCAEKPQLALTLAKTGTKIEEVECENPIEMHYFLGGQLNFGGTPALVYDDGTMNIGYRNAERLALELGIN